MAAQSVAALFAAAKIVAAQFVAAQFVAALFVVLLVSAKSVSARFEVLPEALFASAARVRMACLGWSVVQTQWSYQRNRKY